MKFLARIGLLWVMLLSVTLVAAQENGNRDSKNRIVRGPYETNRFTDNIFIGVAGGINIYHGENSSLGKFGKTITPAVDLNVGKWFTPALGLRLGYSGISARNWSVVGERQIVVDGVSVPYSNPYNHKHVDGKLYETKFGVSYLHGDIMLNFSDAVGGYKETRRWDFVPFAGVGWARSYANHECDNEIAFSLGLLNTVRLIDWLDLTIEMRHIFVNPRFDKSFSIDGAGRGEGMFSATVGLAFKVGRTGFKRVRAAVSLVDIANYSKRIETLTAANNTLTKQNQELNSKNETLRKSNAAAEAKIAAANKAVAEANAAAKSAEEKAAAAAKRNSSEQSTAQPQTTQSSANNAAVRYAVQIAASRRSVPITSPDFRSFSGKVKMYTAKSGIYPYKYCVYESDTLEEAQRYLPQAQKVFPRAFIVKCQGSRIVD